MTRPNGSGHRGLSGHGALFGPGRGNSDLSAPFMLEILRFSPPGHDLLAASVGVGLLAGGWYGPSAALRRRRSQAFAVGRPAAG